MLSCRHPDLAEYSSSSDPTMDIPTVIGLIPSKPSWDESGIDPRIRW